MPQRIDARALAALLFLFPVAAGAQWTPGGVALTTAPSPPGTWAVCPDASGGIVAAWSEVRSGSSDIIAARITGSGVAVWEADGVVVCSAAFDQVNPAICPDGAGGTIITWRDQRSGALDIYAQRIDANGFPVWTANGIGVCTVTNNQYGPVPVPDGAGGAIIVWYDYRALSYDVYAQRVDANGNTLWATGGVPIYAGQYNQYSPVAVSDGAGGAVVAWSDLRNGNADIYARRVDGSGNLLWSPSGVAFCATTGDQLDPVLVSDGTGGAIAAWRDARNGNWDVFAQRVEGAGTVAWTANGVAVCTAPLDQMRPSIACDGAGGVFLAWDDARGSSMDIYAQRLNSGGAAQWTAGGIALCTAALEQSRPSIACDGTSSAIVAWQDLRTGVADIYAQRVDTAGGTLWAANGNVVCNVTGDQTAPRAVADGAAGAVIAWSDTRAGNADLYASRIGSGGGSPTGVRTPAATAFFVSAGYPNPSSRAVNFTFEKRAGRVVLEVFDVTGRRVSYRETGLEQFAFDGRDDAGRPLPGGVYLCRFRSGNETAVRKILIAR